MKRAAVRPLQAIGEPGHDPHLARRRRGLTLAATAAQSAQVSYYQLPAGAYPHDVAPAADGTVWFSGQRQGFAGRFDPTTGKLEEIPLGPGAAPHGVIVGPDGAPWFTEGGQNAIARVDPATRAVTLFRLPKEFARANLNTAVFDKTGMLWFTGQTGVHGRVDPEDRQGRRLGVAARPRSLRHHRHARGRRLVRLARGRSHRAGRSRDRRGDHRRAAAQGLGPRRIWSDSKGMLWVSFWTAGDIGRYDPAKKIWTHYPMPKSKAGTYSVYVDDKDRVWATDWVANAIQRFDPVTETYTTFPSDKRNANVRQMLGRPGEAWGGESGTDRLVVMRD